MRSVAFSEFGSAPTLIEIDTPQPAEGEVRVRVAAASVNGFDLAVAAGYLKDMMEHRFPVVLGKDFAGTIDALGNGVEGFAIGDRVFGVVSKPYLGDGSFGEYVTVTTAVGLAKLPEGVDVAEGAALGLAGTAAATAIDGAQLTAGSTVLIAGATGGVGNLAVQLAVAAGARVIATAHSDDEIAQVTALGASSTVDYTGDVAAAVLAAHPHGVDVIVHLAGDPAVLLAAAGNGARFVSTLIGDPAQLPSEAVTVVPVFANPTADVLERLASDQASGATRVVIQERFGLADFADAFAAFAGGTQGKLVLITE